MLGDQFIEVEADDATSAQDFAFAKHIRALKPQDFTVWETGKGDEWAKNETTGD